MATKQVDDDGGASLFFMDLSLTYRPPRSPLRRFFWRWRIFFETTFALSVMEGWEKVLILGSIALFWCLLVAGIYHCLPYHLQFLSRRTVHYLSGIEQNDSTPVRQAGAALLSAKTPHASTAEL